MVTRAQSFAGLLVVAAGTSSSKGVTDLTRSRSPCCTSHDHCLESLIMRGRTFQFE